MRWLTRLASGGTALLLLAGCGGNGAQGEGPASPLDEGQAEDRVKEHITESTTTALPESLELESFGGFTKPACENPDLISVGQKNWLRGLEPEDNEEHVEALHEYWTGNGYTVSEDQRPDDLSVFVRNDEDDFTMSVNESAEGDLSVGASSPCIDPNGSGE